MLTVLSTVLLQAQEYRGRIQGTVEDPSGATIAGASATLRNTATNLPTVGVTDKAGHYLFDLVEPGTYTLKVEAPGFAPYEEQSIILRQHGDVTIDASLRTGGVNETVSVTAQNAQVQFNSSKLETTIDSQITANIPQFYRDPFYLSKADPAVVQNETRLESQPYHSTGTGTQQIGGSNGMNLIVDGRFREPGHLDRLRSRPRYGRRSERASQCRRCRVWTQSRLSDQPDLQVRQQ
ncbi:MAG: carboxypeptidase-like regulatory domain-containing protein [Ignavibacteriota bacterium]